MSFSRSHISFIILLFVIVYFGCEKRFDEYYKIPDDLIGTILDVLEEDGNYTQFVKAVELVEFDDALGKTGNFTVFAPDDNAFQEYFTETGYSTLEDIPEEELKGLVFYHILFWSYSKFKLLYGLGVEDVTIDYSTESFKKETRYRPPLTIEYDELGFRYTVYHEYKYIPIFSDEYFEEQEINGSYNYTFLYPATSYTGFNADRAEIVEYDVPAQNGWIHKINKVLVPPDNHDQILNKYGEFSQFKELINQRTYYQYSDRYTRQQKGEGDIDDDGILDSLFLKKNDLLPLTYSLDLENIGESGQANFLTMFVPTNNALQQFLNERMKGYPSLEVVGEFWMDWYLSHYFDFNYWPSEFSNMTEDWRMDLTSLLVNSNISENDIVYSQMASNGPFIGINKYLLPKIFETVAQPIFGDRKYEWFCELLIFYMVDILLNKEEIEFTVFAPDNNAMNLSGYSARYGLGGFGLYDNNDPLEPVPRNRATDIIKSHVVFGVLDETDFEEGTFIKTIQNSFIGVESNGIYGGGVIEPASIGIPDNSGINGVVYPIDRMLISPGTNLLNTLTDQVNNPEFKEFYKLLLEAGMILFDEDFNYIAMENISTGISYTCFVPPNDIITKAIGDGLIPTDKEELKQFLRYHFLEGIIFSDGENSGIFKTTRYENEAQNTFSTIEILNEKYNLRVKDNMENTRQITTANIMASDGVIHVIDSLLYYK